MRQYVRRTACFLFAFLFLLCAFPLASAKAASAPPEVEAASYAVIDAATGQLLFAKDGNVAQYPASITKILTLGLSLEAFPQLAEGGGDNIEVSYRACHELIYNATHIALSEGEQVPFRDLIYATQIESANDAANVLAEFADGSLEAFADRMNQKAAALGLSGSNFVNPSGQPNEGHFTTACDMAQITRWAMSVPGFREVFAATGYDMAPTNKRASGFSYRNRNLILNPDSSYYYPGVTGSKMGYTTDARYTLVTSAQRDGMELICVVLNCPTSDTKYTSTTALLDYAFDSFAPVQFPAIDIEPATVPVFGGGREPLGEITVSGGADATLLLHKELTLADITVSTTIPEQYVIGQHFQPMAQLSLPEGAPQERLVASVPLSWQGLDEILAQNTHLLEGGAEPIPTFTWVLFLILAALLIAVLARVIYVRQRRQKRRHARLLAAQMRMPIRIAERPPARAGRNVPPSRRRPAAAATRQAARFEVYQRQAASRQRHAGGAH